MTCNTNVLVKFKSGPSCSKMDKAIHWVKLCPVDNRIIIDFPNTYPLDSAIQHLNNRNLMDI